MGGMGGDEENRCVAMEAYRNLRAAGLSRSASRAATREIIQGIRGCRASGLEISSVVYTLKD